MKKGVCHDGISPFFIFCHERHISREVNNFTPLSFFFEVVVVEFDAKDDAAAG